MLILILPLILAAVAIALAVRHLPTSYAVERSITIAAPNRRVFPLVARLDERPRWSAWYEREPAATTRFAGPEHRVGHSMSWDGKKIGRGSVTVTVLEPDRRIETNLELAAPVAMRSTDSIEVVSLENEHSRVVWRNTGTLRGMQRLMGPFMGKIIGPDYDRGLANLKRVIEAT